jgi:pimeloyl-ACP methyl ester carboxylesterase
MKSYCISHITVYFLHIALLMFCMALTTIPVNAATDTKACRFINVPIALAPNLPALYNIYGELCSPSSGPSNTVQLLIPGGTYSHIYWDFPYQPQNYSYVRALNKAGYSTLNIDPIGTGQSSHPLSALVTMDTNAYVVHEIVQDLRNGRIANQSFAQVLLVGHSVGSITAWIEAGTYHDVDGVIITGLTHHLNTVNLTAAATTLYPAMLDPRFAGKPLDAGYLTTELGTRGKDFYFMPGVDPNTLATDETTKETVTSGELASFAPTIADGISLHITVPVFVVVGQQDNLFCGLLATDCSSETTVQQAEAPFYSSQALLQTVVIPNAGHDINLHETAPLWFAAATAWSYYHFAL